MNFLTSSKNRCGADMYMNNLNVYPIECSICCHPLEPFLCENLPIPKYESKVKIW